MEAMLKKELSGISSEEKSKRIRLCKHDTACCGSSIPLLPVPPHHRLLPRVDGLS